MSIAALAMGRIRGRAGPSPQADGHVRAGRWERSKCGGTVLFGKTLGIVGLGKIGTEVAKRAQAFGMQVLAADPVLSTERAQQLEHRLNASLVAARPGVAGDGVRGMFLGQTSTQFWALPQSAMPPAPAMTAMRLSVSNAPMGFSLNSTA